MSHLEDHHILSDEQHGFRKERSCETQHVNVIDDITRCLDSKSQMDLIIMDFSNFSFRQSTPPATLKKTTARRHPRFPTVMDWMLPHHPHTTSRYRWSHQPPLVLHPEYHKVQSWILSYSSFNDLPKSLTSRDRMLADDCVVYREMTSLTESTELQKDIHRLGIQSTPVITSSHITRFRLLQVFLPVPTCPMRVSMH